MTTNRRKTSLMLKNHPFIIFISLLCFFFIYIFLREFYEQYIQYTIYGTLNQFHWRNKFILSISYKNFFYPIQERIKWASFRFLQQKLSNNKRKKQNVTISRSLISNQDTWAIKMLWIYYHILYELQAYTYNYRVQFLISFSCPLLL